MIGGKDWVDIHKKMASLRSDQIENLVGRVMEIDGEGTIEEISDYIYQVFPEAKDHINDGGEESMIYTLIAYANPERKSEIAKCKYIMDGEKVFNDDKIPEELKSRDLLWRAVCIGDIKIAQVCIEDNFDINRKYNFGNTVLIWAAQEGHTEVVRVLLEHANSRIDINTLFILAAKNGYTEIASLLTGSGADINARDRAGNTPLIWAIKNALRVWP